LLSKFEELEEMSLVVSRMRRAGPSWTHIRLLQRSSFSTSVITSMAKRTSTSWLSSQETQHQAINAPKAVPTAPVLSSGPGTTEVARLKVKKILSDSSSLGTTVKVQGWVRTIRDQKNFAFISVNDGSCLKDIQIVAEADMATYATISQLTTGAAVEVVGAVVASQGKGQSVEVRAQSVALVGPCPAASYPLQKKRHSQEFLRSIAHLRARTNTISAVARVRSALAFATHQFFQNEGFLYLQTPLITASDCEGAGEMFRVTTLPIDSPELMPVEKQEIRSTEDANASSSKTDFSRDFFGKAAYLTVSGQLSGEAYASALGDIYTFGPTFRAENSQTSRHLAEFHMIEPEMAFADLFAAMGNAEAYVKYVVQHVLLHCVEDLAFFEKFNDKNLLARLDTLANQPFARITYRDAIALLQAEIQKDRKKWQYPDVEFGTDLSTEHERWLAEQHFDRCVFVYNYPRMIKSFYMRDNDDDSSSGQDQDRRAPTSGCGTCASFDLLVPGVGELIGGSQREERLEVLQQKMKDFNLQEKEYSWYLDLRRFGSVPHAGYGLGFERLVCYVTAIENIREAIAFPRYPGSADF